MVKLWFCLEINGVLLQNESAIQGIHAKVLETKSNIIFKNEYEDGTADAQGTQWYTNQRREHQIVVLWNTQGCVCVC